MAAPFPEDTHAGEVGGAGGKWGSSELRGKGTEGWAPMGIAQ